MRRFSLAFLTFTGTLLSHPTGDHHMHPELDVYSGLMHALSNPGTIFILTAALIAVVALFVIFKSPARR